MKTEPVVVQWTKEDLERLMRAELEQKGFELETELDPTFQEPPPDPGAKRRRRKKKYPLGFEWSTRKGEVLVRTVVRSRPLSEAGEEEMVEDQFDSFTSPEDPEDVDDENEGDEDEEENKNEESGMRVSLLQGVDMDGLNAAVAREKKRKEEQKKAAAARKTVKRGKK